MNELNGLIADFTNLQKQMDSILVRMQNLSAKIYVESARVRNQTMLYDCQDL